ncbi:hypothetical protein [Bacillus cereus]|uniref:hypothetical protein n=1 Tax=Bacillus cereus TaxID=1396 RepID=UPI000BED15A7|nr:hypothetical protein [Bacillus cereus]PEF15675.1 hypothetical protein CON87_28200 [Bacillus cereus]PET03688.1 hypothetical protein CN516_29590 [Bacillus cereus]PEV93688.1 hypothetical protein CN433_09610 [Bacillus cereus]PFP50530.1 hypothetical protein COJ98_17590 [Bacillus cereus]
MTATDSSGNVIKNSWVNQGNAYYYADADGIFLKGFQEINGKKQVLLQGFLTDKKVSYVQLNSIQ